jgi:hypothetical protein
MKITLTLLLILLAIFSSLHSNAINPTPKSNDKTLFGLTVGDIVDLNAKEYAKFTGKKLSLKEQIAYGFLKGKLKSELRKGILSPVDSVIKSEDKVSVPFNFGAFVLGFLLGIIGLAIVLLVFKDKEAWRSAVFGLAAVIILYLIFVLAY